MTELYVPLCTDRASGRLGVMLTDPLESKRRRL